MFLINSLITWKGNNEVTDRIVWFDKNSDEVYVININSNKFPEIKNSTYISECIQNETAVILQEDKLLRFVDEDELSSSEKKYRDKAWEIICNIVKQEPDIYRSEYRRKLVLKASEHYKVSESTISRYLKRYWLGGKNKNTLIPDYYNCGGVGKDKKAGESKRGRPRDGKEIIGEGINIDDGIKKVFKSAVNKFYNTTAKNSLTTAYQLMVKEYFKDIENPSLIASRERLPSFVQFRYWFNKQRNFKQEIVKRNSAKKYEQENRAILGDSTSNIRGPGILFQIDATVADLYVVSEFNRGYIIGRPILYMVVDTFSRVITGFYIGLEGPSWIGAATALASVVEDKVKLCKEYDIDIVNEEWPVNNLPDRIIWDRGEGEGKNVENIINNLGISIENTPPFRADWKGIVERSFGLLNMHTKPFLPGRVDKDLKARGEKDYRLDAKLTLREFIQIIIRTILYHNNHHVLQNYDRGELLINDDIKPIPIELWKWGIENSSGILRNLPPEIVKLNLMPTDYATVTGKGIRFKGVYYASVETMKDGWFEKARNNGTFKIKVSYDLRKMDYIYIIKDKGRDYEKCFLLDHQIKYKGKSFEDVQYLLQREKLDLSVISEDVLQAKVNLIDDIEKIVKKAKVGSDGINIGESNNKRLKGIEENRKVEKEINRIEEAFELGIEDTDKKEIDNVVIENENFNNHVRNELMMLRKKQKEALKNNYE